MGIARAAGHTDAIGDPEASGLSGIEPSAGALTELAGESATRAFPLAAGLLVMLFAIGYAGQGGFYPQVQRWLVVVLAAAAAASWRQRRGRLRLVRKALWV